MGNDPLPGHSPGKQRFAIFAYRRPYQVISFTWLRFIGIYFEKHIDNILL